MAAFRRAFDRPLCAENLAEMYAADQLGLKLVPPFTKSHDAVAPNGERYEIKYRAAMNIDIRYFDFEHLVLVNMDDDYRVTAMYRATKEQVESIAVERKKYSKWQIRQEQFIRIAERIV